MKTTLFILFVVLVTSITATRRSKRFIFPNGAACILLSSASTCARQTFDKYYRAMSYGDCLNCDKYFHCQANYDTAHNACWDPTSAKIISDCRDDPSVTDADSLADREANEYGRKGGDCASRYLCANHCSYNPVDKTCQKTNCPR